jgi:hypothetical protein
VDRNPQRAGGLEMGNRKRAADGVYALPDVRTPAACWREAGN